MGYKVKLKKDIPLDRREAGGFQGDVFFSDKGAIFTSEVGSLLLKY